MYKNIVSFIKELYPNQNHVPLHSPTFCGNEKKYLLDCIDSTFVSSVGKYVDQFEKKIAEFTGAKFAVATTNGTSALHMALMVNNVTQNTEVLTQALTFVATANAITYLGAHPVFIDSAKDNLGMCSLSLERYLEENAIICEEYSINKFSKRRISACVPMHVFGHPVEIHNIAKICNRYKIKLVEDCAESLGSYVGEQHTGLVGATSVFSFNGNKVITCGGGGMIVTNDELIAKKAKHLTTTAKIAHKWDFFHDEVGYNYRLPNINAALGLAQLELIEQFLLNKRQTADAYKEFFKDSRVKFIEEPKSSKSNFWLNAIRFECINERDEFLDYSNSNGVMTRPLWYLMSDLPAFSKCTKTDLQNAIFHQNTIVNLPSGVRGN